MKYAAGRVTMSLNRTFVCKTVMPGVYCHLPEMVALGCLFFLSACLCIFFLVYHQRKSRTGCTWTDDTVWFWVSTSIWHFFRGIVSIFAFPWTEISYELYFLGLNHILLFIPMSLMILTLFNLLFLYRNPGSNAVAFFRVLFLTFLIMFLLIGVLLVFMNTEGQNSEETISLWTACTNFVLAVMFFLSSRALLKAVTYPAVQPEDARCVGICKLGMVVFLLLFLARMCYNFFHFLGYNVLQNWIDDEIRKEGDIPSGGVRAFTCVFWLVFDWLPSVLSLLAVGLLKKHDLMFNENPYYTRGSD